MNFISHIIQNAKKQGYTDEEIDSFLKQEELQKYIAICEKILNERKDL